MHLETGLLTAILRPKERYPPPAMNTLAFTAKASAIAGLAFIIAGCGLSEEDKASYSKEIKLVREYIAIDENAIQKIRNLFNQASIQGVRIPTEAMERQNERLVQYSKKGSYIQCLERYEKAQEKFYKAKTRCVEESGVSLP